MSFEKELPEWKAEGTQPPESKREEGFKAKEKPPASWHNWFFNKTYEAIKELQEKGITVDEIDEVLDGYIKISEKGKSNGVAQLDKDGKVVDADGNHVEGKVKSVNGKTGEVELKASDVGGYSREDVRKKVNEARDESKKYTNEQISSLDKSDVGLGKLKNEEQANKTEFSAHLEDDSAHGIGDKSSLKTDEKSTIVGAMNELFTNVSDGKEQIGTAITDVDENVDVPNDATFEDFSDLIREVAGERMMWASGTEESERKANDDVISVRDLSFKPNYIIIEEEGGGSRQSFIYKSSSGDYRYTTSRSNDYRTGNIDDANGNMRLFDDGFNAICQFSPTTSEGKNYDWIAFE